VTPEERDALVAGLRWDEGVRPFPYTDTVGKLTIGVGRNLSDRGLSNDEIDYLLQNDIDLVIDDLNRALPWWVELSPARQRVLANMCFNLGIARLKGFVRTLAAMRRGDYAAAAQGMRESLWAKQVGARAERLARLMEAGS
jgi:lysozyme